MCAWGFIMSAIKTKIDHWIKNNLNVCLVGRHGVGKTAMIKSAFDRHELRWRYFSASTMDPWTDFVGVPKERTDNKLPPEFAIIKELASINIVIARQWVINNWKMSPAEACSIVDHALNHKEGNAYLDFIRPRFLGGDDRGIFIPNEEIEALFFDEYNRSSKKIRNAVMELIQFKSINGYKFPNLRFVWIAINPDDEDQIHYDVEEMDEAQADRFQVKVQIPYRPDVEWFRENYGQRMADGAINWWDELDEDNKRKVSPRRLQYALDCAMSKGDLHDVIPPSCNVGKLISTLKDGPITEKLEELMRNNDHEQTKKFLKNENNCTSSMKYIPKSEKLMGYFLPHIPKEKLISLMDTDNKICNYVIYNLDKHDVFKSVCQNIQSANLNAGLHRKIRLALTENENLLEAFHKEPSNLKTLDFHCNKKKNNEDYLSLLEKLKIKPIHTETQRIGIYDLIQSDIPEKMSKDAAIKTLELLSDIFNKNDDFKTENEKSKWQFASILTQPQFSKLVGIVNHCIETIKSIEYPDLNSIVAEYGKNFKPLFDKLIQAGVGSKLTGENL